MKSRKSIAARAPQEETEMKLTLENGKKYQPKADDPVVCEDHGVTVRWGDLSAMQKQAVSESLDIVGERCILLPEFDRGRC